MRRTETARGSEQSTQNEFPSRRNIRTDSHKPGHQKKRRQKGREPGGENPKLKLRRRKNREHCQPETNRDRRRAESRTTEQNENAGSRKPAANHREHHQVAHIPVATRGRENEDQFRENRAGLFLLREDIRPFQVAVVRIDDQRRHFPVIERRHLDRIMPHEVSQVQHRDKRDDPDQDEDHPATARRLFI